MYINANVTSIIFYYLTNAMTRIHRITPRGWEFLLVFVITVSVVAVQTAETRTQGGLNRDPKCLHDRVNVCPDNRFKHYTDRGCQAFYAKAGECCPASFNCSSAILMGREAVSPNDAVCTYGGRVYRVGQNIELEDPCRMCKCTALSDTKPFITCATMDCPLELNSRPSGCDLLYTPGQCCASSTTCETRSPLSGQRCQSAGREYIGGEKIVFPEFPCRECICTANFTGPDGHGCYDIDCSANQLSFIEKGCMPVYLDGFCCPIDWTCPDQTRQIEPKNLKEACLLPRDTGPCLAAVRRFSYNPRSQKCTSFIFGGCGGNENNFLTKKDCDVACVEAKVPEIAPDGTPSQCLLPSRVGPCRASFQRWFYDSNTKSCTQFTYGGCLGNANNFKTKNACENRCIRKILDDEEPADDREGRDLADCFLPKSVGPCRASIERYFFNATKNQCEKFTYGGCRGNRNNFKKQENCFDLCARVRRPDLPFAQPSEDVGMCYMPKLKGNCNAFTARYYYSFTAQKCKRFYFSGCNGNENNFPTMDECRERCANPMKDDAVRQRSPVRPASIDIDDDPEDGCLYDGQRFKVGSILDIGKPCITCTCMAPPSMTCVQKRCPPTPVDVFGRPCTPRFVPGVCCPVYHCPT